MKAACPILGNKEQKSLFLIFSLSDMHTDFDFVPPFILCDRSGAQIKLYTRKIWCVKINLSSPEHRYFPVNTSKFLRTAFL